MTESFALKYRPRRFSQMVGQGIIATVLNKMVEKDAVPRALLFSGDRGTGKTSAARILAMELNPEEREQVLSGTSLSVIEIDAASNGGVQDIRNLIGSLRYSTGTERRVVILDEAHSISHEGFNTLLKTLEEPPQGVYFVLVTTEPEKLPVTILSRVNQFEFRRVPPVDIYNRCLAVAKHENLDVSEDLIRLLVERAAGSMRDALMALDLVSRAEIHTVEEFINLTGERDTAPKLFLSLMSGDHSKIFEVADDMLENTGDPKAVLSSLQHLIRDVLVLKAEGSLRHTGDALEIRKKLALRLELDRLVTVATRIMQTKISLRNSEDGRGDLEIALILVSDVLTRGKTPMVKSTPIEVLAVSIPEAPQKLTLSELQQS